jgi:hypothetical protein
MKSSKDYIVYRRSCNQQSMALDIAITQGGSPPPIRHTRKQQTFCLFGDMFYT